MATVAGGGGPTKPKRPYVAPNPFGSGRVADRPKIDAFRDLKPSGPINTKRLGEAARSKRNAAVLSGPKTGAKPAANTHKPRPGDPGPTGRLGRLGRGGRAGRGKVQAGSRGGTDPMSPMPRRDGAGQGKGVLNRTSGRNPVAAKRATKPAVASYPEGGRSRRVHNVPVKTGGGGLDPVKFLGEIGSNVSALREASKVIPNSRR